jgi:coenzyme F420-0:L-glutamate ligase/coenzyme F420-1:gamma-L-glutamate ligase
MFGYGAREAVVRALLGEPADRAPFGAPAPAHELADVLRTVTAADVRTDGRELVVTSARPEAVAALAFAHGWAVGHRRTTDSPVEVRLHPVTP